MDLIKRLEQANVTFPSTTIMLLQEAAFEIKMLRTLRDDNLTLMDELNHKNDMLENIYRACPAGCDIHTAIKQELGLDDEE